jgi:hypothetical protein
MMLYVVVGNARSFMATLGVAQGTLGSPVIADSEAAKSAAGFSTAWSFIHNGAVIGSAVPTIPTVTKLHIGQGATGVEPVRGGIRSLSYYNKRVST